METYRDVIYSDRLNHASIIDGQRLCRAETTDRKIYKHADMDDLVRQLEEDQENGLPAPDHRDGRRVQHGGGPCSARPAGRDRPAVRRDSCSWTIRTRVGVCGKTRARNPGSQGVHGKVDVLTGTLGKAIGGAAGGYISGKKELIAFMRQKARTYIFSNSLPPSIVFGAGAAFDLLMKDRSHRPAAAREHRLLPEGDRRRWASRSSRGIIRSCPIMLGDAAVAQEMSKALLKEGVYIKGLWFPVVPKGEARLRAQISAALRQKDIDRALEAFEKVGRKMNLI